MITLSFYLCFFVLAAAVRANFSVFIDASIEAIDRYRRVSWVMFRANALQWRVLSQVLCTMWKIEKRQFANFVISVVVVNVGLLLAVVMGWLSARSTVLSFVRGH